MVIGGAGSVAHYAIQFAKLRGARVITTVSGPEKAAHARSAGHNGHFAAAVRVSKRHRADMIHDTQRCPRMGKSG